jgi:hypothetical protein
MHTIPHTLEARKKMSATKMGKHYSPRTEFKVGQVAPMKGKKRPDLIGNTQGFTKGHIPWNKGLGTKSSENEKARKVKLARDWRKSIFERDDYTCKECGVRGGTLNAHHIKPFAIYPELRYELDNGITLCEECHRSTDTWGVRGTNGVFSLT